MAYQFYLSGLYTFIGSWMMKGLIMAALATSLYVTALYWLIDSKKPWHLRSKLKKRLTLLAWLLFILMTAFFTVKKYFTHGIEGEKPYKTLDSFTSQYEFRLLDKSDELSDTLKKILAFYYPNQVGYEKPSQDKLVKLKSRATKEKIELVDLLQLGIGKFGNDIDLQLGLAIRKINRIYEEVLLGKKESLGAVFAIFEDQDKIQESINKNLIGYSSESEAENAYILLQVPKAISALQQNPNNKKLCQVMQLPLAGDHPDQTAQQIAFMRVGQKYCSDYYSKKSSWGALISDKSYQGDKSNLKLPYSVYFDKQVKPKIPKAIEYFRHNKKEICEVGNFNDNERNSKLDALRQAYLLKRNEFCSKESLNRYYNTGQSCLVINEFMSRPNQADFVEKCKETPGVLFASE